MRDRTSSAPELYREYWAAPTEPRLRARVNDSLVSTGEFAEREEAAANGLVLIETDVPLRDVIAAELVLELWGGHPHTSAKCVTVNGHTTYALPPDGTESGHCTYCFPVLPIRTGDLVRGTNALQFACDRGAGFWGHFIVDNAALRLHLDPSVWPADPAGIGVETVCWDPDGIVIAPRLPDGVQTDLLVVEALHLGYAREGGLAPVSWALHSGTKDRIAYGSLAAAPGQGGLFAAPAPTDLPQPLASAVRMTVGLGEAAARFWSDPFHGNTVGSVMLAPIDPPVPFWSRAGKTNRTLFSVAAQQLERAASARLHARFWNGGAGTVTTPVLLNDAPVGFDLTGAPHDLSNQVADIPLEHLRPGSNTFTLTSDTEHHGIEVLLPGPVLELVPDATST